MDKKIEETFNLLHALITTMDTDKLDRLFDNQKQLMKVLGMSVEPEPDILNSPLFKDILICTIGECAEALEPLAVETKPWKHATDRDEVREHIKEEIVDILFFVLELFIMAGLSPDDVVRMHTVKQQKNIIRAAGKSKSAEVVAGWEKPNAYVHVSTPGDLTPMYDDPHRERAYKNPDPDVPLGANLAFYQTPDEDDFDPHSGEDSDRLMFYRQDMAVLEDSDDDDQNEYD